MNYWSQTGVLQNKMCHPTQHFNVISHCATCFGSL